MNRIQEFNGQFQVLISGTTEDFLGRLSRFSVSNTYLENYNTLEEAQIKSFSLPDLNWFTIVNYHKHEYKRLTNDIKEIINTENITILFENKLKTPEELKESVFNRLNHYKNEFILDDNINDIISFHISNPWTENIIKLSNLFQKNNKLNIKFVKNKDNKIFNLIGINNNNTSYSIYLYPSVIYKFIRLSMNKKDKSNINKLYKESLVLQNTIDKSNFIV